MTKVEKIKTMPIGATIDYRYGLSTREVYRKSENDFELHSFIDGWLIADVTIETFEKLECGEINMFDLDWK